MANKSAITARIPENLFSQVEQRAKELGKSKTDVLTEALTEYFGADPNSSRDIHALEQEIHAFQNWAYTRIGTLEQRLFSLERKALAEEQNTEDSPKSIPASQNDFPRLLSAGKDCPIV